MKLPRLPHPRESGTQAEWNEALIRVLQGFLQETAIQIGDGRHVKYRVQQNGVDLGTAGTVEVLNFVGTGFTVNRIGSTVTITLSGSPPTSLPIWTEAGFDLETEAALPLLTE